MAAEALNAGKASRGGREEAEIAATLDGGAELERLDRHVTEASLDRLWKRTQAALAGSALSAGR